MTIKEHIMPLVGDYLELNASLESEKMDEFDALVFECFEGPLGELK